MKILVIVVTYNGMQWLEKCLGSVAESVEPADLFVVDNASSDGSADYVQKHFPKAKLVRNAQNLGFAEGNNLGLRYALEQGYDYIYLLNQDAWLEPDTLGGLVAVSKAHAGFGILSPVQTQADGKVNPIFRRDVVARAKATGQDGLLEAPFMMAAHWFLTAECLRRVGLFADIFPIYGNDDNYCHRVLYHGFRIGYVENLAVVHDKQYGPQSKDYRLYRNFYMSALVALCDIRKPLWLQWLHVVALTLVKTVKYFSFRPWGYLHKMLTVDAAAVRALREETSK